MISKATERTVLAMLAAGRTIGEICDATGLARGTVRRRKAGYRVRPRRAASGISREMDLPPPLRPRCPTCGARLARVPCYACYIRGLIAGADSTRGNETD